MADAPSGGGSSWGAFEVILGILLAIALLSNIGNKGKFQPLFSETPTKEVSPEQLTANNKCGLSIIGPTAFQKVSNTIRLSGSINGCNWKPDGSTALFVQVINAGGAPISEFVAVPSSTTENITTNFDTNITLNAEPSSTGFIILLPAYKTDKSITVRIPLKFVRN
jgi:hypothetical protein